MDPGQGQDFQTSYRSKHHEIRKISTKECYSLTDSEVTPKRA